MARHRLSFRIIFSALSAGAATFLALAGGCSGGGGDSGGILESVFGTSTTVRSSTQPSQPDEPMTLFEKRRLVARLQQDPRALQRLTPRERREVAAMVAAANGNQDDEQRD